jgi:putative ATP-binding cassette transporter
MWRALEGLDANAAHDASHIEIGESTDGTIQLIAVSVAQHDRAVVIDESDVVITKGQHVLLTGASGTGKSTLIRAIAGLWPWGTGQVLLPAGARIAFMPQTPYLPPGSLRNLLEYSATEPAHDDELLTQALERCGLRRLASRLDDTENWVHVLSGGEQQRLSFARLLVQPPDIVLMDGATNALDADTQQDMMNLLREELSACTVITVGQSEDVANFYNVTLTLTRRKDVAQVSMSSETENPNADRGGPAALWRRWAKAFVPPKMSD